MDDDIKERLQSKDLWMRALYMVFFAIVSVIARAVINLLAIVQFIAIAFTGRANEPLLQVGNNLSRYVYQIIQFVTFNSEGHPFPFAPWPDEPVGDNPWVDDDGPDTSEVSAVKEPVVATQTLESDGPGSADDDANNRPTS